MQGTRKYPINMPESLYADAQRSAAELGESLASWIRDAMRVKLAEEQRKESSR